jgi:hypothetical protein
VDNPNDRCLGCGCPTIAANTSNRLQCGGECPPNLECIVENPFCGGDDCKSIRVAFDERNSTVVATSGILPDRPVSTVVIQDWLTDCEGVCVQKIGAFVVEPRESAVV